jgi:hypothetical protein
MSTEDKDALPKRRTPAEPFAVEQSLARALNNTGVRRAADSIFFDWPMLRPVAKRFTRYVTPLIELEDGSNLLERSLQMAVEAYNDVTRSYGEEGVRAFLEALAQGVDPLSALRLSVRTREGHWAIWNYDQPLSDWMAAHERRTVQIKRREQPVERGPIRLKMLSYVCSVRDMQMARIDLRQII